MAETPTDVLVGGYQDIDTATKDFDVLVALVKDKKVEIEGVILVTHAEDGSVTVQQTWDNLGRKGMGWAAASGSRWASSRRRCSPRRRSEPLQAGWSASSSTTGRDRDARQDRREPAARLRRDHRRVRRRAAARDRAGAPRARC
jgi:hypothetical protein